MNQNNLPVKSENILFVSDLPRETNEDDLYDFFKNYHLTSAKVQKSKSSIFAHVFFENSDYANKARKDLNGEILTPKYSEKKIGKPVRICKYEPKSQIMENIKDSTKSLLIKNLDRDVSAKEFFKLFEEFGEVKSSKLEVDDNGVSKGYGYIYFNDSKSAELAKQKLNGKEINGLKLEVVNLIPSKSKDNTRNNIYVKNIPKNFTDEDLWKLFSKYGDITSAVVSRDDKGQGKGFGFVCFANPLHAVQACKDLKEKGVGFPGLPPLYVNFLMKKEDRVNTYIKREEIQQDTSANKFVAVLTDMSSFGLSDSELENEVRLFIKVVLLTEYFPKKIEVNMNNRSAVVTMNSPKDLADFWKKYPESAQMTFLKFTPMPFTEQGNENLMPYPNEQMFGMNPMMSMFQNLSLVNKPVPTFYPDSIKQPLNPMTPVNFVPGMQMVYPMQVPNMIPQQGFPNFQNKFGGYPQTQKGYHNNKGYFNQNQNRPNYGNKNISNNYFNTRKPNTNTSEDDPTLKEEAGAQIYEIVEKMYPDDAGKITGMVMDLGLEEMKTLLSQSEKLNKVIEEAHEMLHNDH